MAEEEVSYASVVFKKRSESKAETREEPMHNEVKIHNEVVPDKTGLLSDKGTKTKYQQLACCFGTLCVFLLLVIIGVYVYIVLLHWEVNQIEVNQTSLMEENYNLTNFNNKLRAENENKKIQLDNVRQNCTDLKNMISELTVEKQNLTSENKQLKKLNQELQKNLTAQIQNMMKTQNELNVSRAQWSIDAYCLKERSVRKCNSCQKGWLHFQSSCYAYNDAKPADQKTWEEARKNCSGKNSDLTVVADEKEKWYKSDWTRDYWLLDRFESCRGEMDMD